MRKKNRPLLLSSRSTSHSTMPASQWRSKIRVRKPCVSLTSIKRPMKQSWLSSMKKEDLCNGQRSRIRRGLKGQKEIG